MSDPIQQKRETDAVAVEAAALDFRAAAKMLMDAAHALRSVRGPESFIRDAEKIAADLRVVESCARRFVENNL